VTLPVLDPAFEVSDSLHILSSALSFVNLVRDTLGGCTSFLEFVVVRIFSGRCSFQKGLTEGELVHDPAKPVGVTYLEQKRIFANPLNRFDEKSWEFGFYVDQVVVILVKKVRLY